MRAIKYFDLLESSDAKLEEIEQCSKAPTDSKNREEGNKKLQEEKSTAQEQELVG